jgi:predicted nuclease of restriction endonuclease-like (RecB) superfamily
MENKITDYTGQFTEVIQLINQARGRAIKAVNKELVSLYWNIGGYISNRIENGGWGQSVVTKLAEYIEKDHPDLKGFTARNLWRMRQLFDTYKDLPNLTTLLAEISWSHNIAIFSRCKTNEEREFYIKQSIKEQYSFRELERQISSSLFERAVIGNATISPAVRATHPDIASTFKDTYVFEFLNLQEPHNESELQKGLLQQMKNFILELGKDFLFMDEEYKVQVGNSDFYIDLVFYHRSLQCLVAFELKTDKFKPEYLGQLNFYLEALDRDVRKEKENPSIGVLLCKDKDNEVVEYALSRSLSPTLVAEYTIQLPDKKILQQKLHDLYEADTSNQQ